MDSRVCRISCDLYILNDNFPHTIADKITSGYFFLSAHGSFAGIQNLVLTVSVKILSHKVSTR